MPSHEILSRFTPDFHISIKNNRIYSVSIELVEILNADIGG